MGQAPNLGLVGAGGAQALQNEIQKMIAERQEQERLMYERAIAEREWTAKQQEAEETRAHRAALQGYQLEDLKVRQAAAAQPKAPSIIQLKAFDPTTKTMRTFGVDEATGQRLWEMDTPEAPPRQEPTSFQSETVMVNGVPTLASYDPKTKQYSDQSGRPLPNAQPMPARDPVMLIQTMDAQGRPIIQGLPQSQVRGQTFGAQPSAAQQTDMAQLESGVNLIQGLRDQFKPEYVGPVEGRLRPAGQAIGATGSPGQAQFYGAAASLKNEIIRLITGAGVGLQEAERITKEIPEITDPDTVFLEKLTQTEKNRVSLLNAIRNRAGIGPPQPPAAPGGRGGGAGRPSATPGGEEWERGPDGRLRRKGGL